MANNPDAWGLPQSNQAPSQVTRDSVQDSHSLLASYPMASATPSAHVARHLSNIVPAPPPSFVQHNYYTLHASFNTPGNPPPYTEYAHEVNYLASAQHQTAGFWEAARNDAVRLIHEQAGPSYPYPPQFSTSTTSYPSNAFSQSLFQQATPSNAYPTPPPPILPSSSSLANALGPLPTPQVHYQPQQSAAFFDSYLSQKAKEMGNQSTRMSNQPTRPTESNKPRRQTGNEAKRPSTPPPRPQPPPESPDPIALTASTSMVTPKKRKPVVELVSPSLKRIHSKDAVKISTPSSVAPSTPRTSVPATPATTVLSSTPTSRGTPNMELKPYVSVPRMPWVTPVSSRKASEGKMDDSPDDLGGYGTPEGSSYFSSSPFKSARKTGDRDDRAPVEKLVALLEDIFEAEDNLSPDIDVGDLPEGFFSRELSVDVTRPLLNPDIIRKLTQKIGGVARPAKKFKAAGGTPKGKSGRMGEVDVQMLSRILRVLNRTVKVGEDIDPFSGIKALGGSGGQPSPKKKKGKGKSSEGADLPEDDVLADGEQPYVEGSSDAVDLDKLERTLHMTRDSVLAAECCIALLASDRLTKQLYSEELITTCLDSIKNQLTRIIYPFVESYVPDSSQSFSYLQSSHRKLISEIFSIVSSVLPRIETLLNTESVSVSDSIIIKAVYIAIGPFFVVDGTDGDAPKSKKSGSGEGSIIVKMFGKSAMRGLRLNALSLIRSIFAARDDQRSWIIEEILMSLIKLSDTKQKAGQFRLRDGRSIRTVSALLLQLVQTSAHDVRIAAKRIKKDRQKKFALRRQESLTESQTTQQQDEPFLDEHDAEEIRLYEGGLDSAIRVAKTIIHFLTQRSGKNKTTKNTNEAEYRTIFDHLIHDLLVVLHWPEWPAASLLLTIACKYMVSSLDDIKSSNHQDNNAAKTIALDHLGVIAARIRSTAFKVHGGDAGDGIKSRKLRPMDEIVSELRLGALDKLLGAHKEVATHLVKRSEEDQAYDSAQELTAATLGHELARGLTQINRRLTEDEDDINLKATSTSEDVSKLAEFGQKIKTAMQEVWKDQATDFFNTGSEEEVRRIDRLSEEIGSIQGLRNSFQPILTVILAALDSPAIFMRTKALKALGQIVTADASILSAANVRRAIEAHLLDSSPAVRDAAVELIGKYMVDMVDVAGDYYPKIADRMADTGLSVRKRVIKLLKSFYGVIRDTERQIDIATRMVLRMMDEDDSVKDLAMRSIEELWFPDPSIPGGKTRSGVIDKGPLLSKVVVIMGVSSKFQDRQSPLETILHKIMADKSESEAAAMHSHYVEVCETLIDGLVDATDFPGFTVVNCIRAIYLFTSAYPAVLSGANASTLLPYLKNPTSTEDQVTCDYLLKIFRASIPHMPKTTAKFGSELQTALQPMIIKPSPIGGLQALQETVACICTVVQHLTHDYVRLVALLKSCNHRVQQALRQPDDKPPDFRPLSVLVFIVSLLVEHCDFDQLRLNNSALKSELDSLTKDSITLYVYMSLIKLHNKFEDAGFRGRILQCLGFLFRAHPTLMTNEASAAIMDSNFSSPDIESRAKLLKIIQDFLVSEAAKHAAQEKANSKKTPKTTNVNMDELIGNTDGFADSGVSSAIVQRYLTHILEAVLSQYPQIQASAIDILSFTIKQGLAHPLQSFPVIVALETSSSAPLSNRASVLHSLLHAKHTSLLSTRYSISARASFDYQQKLTQGQVRGFRLQPTPVALLQQWYSLVREKRPTRQDFLKSLVKVFQEKGQSVSQDDVDFTRYMAENFSAFEYKTLEEVLTVIKYLTNVLSTTGMAVLEAISPSHLLNRLRSSGTDVEMTDGTQSSIGNTADRVPLMRSSVIVAMVMLLKSHLKSLYSLSEDKCSKFVIGKKTAVGDKPATKRNDKPISWDRLKYATTPILTTEHVNEQKTAFISIWNEDGVTAEPEDDTEVAAP